MRGARPRLCHWKAQDVDSEHFFIFTKDCRRGPMRRKSLPWNPGPTRSSHPDSFKKFLPSPFLQPFTAVCPIDFQINLTPFPFSLALIPARSRSSSPRRLSARNSSTRTSQCSGARLMRQRETRRTMVPPSNSSGPRPPPPTSSPPPSPSRPMSPLFLDRKNSTKPVQVMSSALVGRIRACFV